MVIAGIQTNVDGIFLSIYTGNYAMASINIAQPFIQFIAAVYMILCMGCLSLTSRKIGGNNISDARDSFKTTYILILLCSGTIVIIGTIFSKQLALLLGASDVLLKMTSEYIFSIALFSPSIMLMYFSTFMSRLLGKPNLYVISAITTLVVNIILDLFFVKILKFGTFGAGLATSLAFTSGFLATCRPIFKKSSLLNVFRGKFNKIFIRDILYNGASEGIICFSNAITIFLFNYVFSKIAGDDGIVAYTALNYITTFALYILFGMGDGATAIVGVNFGAKHFKRVKQTFKIGVLVNVTIGTLIFLLVLVFSRQITGIFIHNNEKILDFASNGAKIYATFFIVSGINIFTSAYFTALGKAKQSVIISICRGIIFIILGIFVLPLIFGEIGVWTTLLFAECVTVIISYILIKKNKLKSK